MRNLAVTEAELTAAVPYIVLIDRNDTSLRWHIINSDDEYDRRRIVGNVDDIAEAIQGAFPEYRIHVHRHPYGTLRKQAVLYGGAAAIVGPHGAAESNFIFCRQGTPVVEFTVLGKGPNSPLYAAIARDLDLTYWTIPMRTLQVVDPSLVVKTLHAALLRSPQASDAVRTAPATAVVALTTNLYL